MTTNGPAPWKRVGHCTSCRRTRDLSVSFCTKVAHVQRKASGQDLSTEVYAVARCFVLYPPYKCQYIEACLGHMTVLGLGKLMTSVVGSNSAEFKKKLCFHNSSRKAAPIMHPAVGRFEVMRSFFSASRKCCQDTGCGDCISSNTLRTSPITNKIHLNLARKLVCVLGCGMLCPIELELTTPIVSSHAGCLLPSLAAVKMSALQQTLSSDELVLMLHAPGLDFSLFSGFS